MLYGPFVKLIFSAMFFPGSSGFGRHVERRGIYSPARRVESCQKCDYFPRNTMP